MVAVYGVASGSLSLDGSWEFRFEEGKCLEEIEEFQDEYLADVFEALWANPDVVGFSIWQMNDGRTRERFGGSAVSAMFGGSVSGVFDRLRRRPHHFVV